MKTNHIRATLNHTDTMKTISPPLFAVLILAIVVGACSDKMTSCGKCFGKGTIPEGERDCPTCTGSGSVRNPCSRCRGSRKVACSYSGEFTETLSDSFNAWLGNEPHKRDFFCRGGRIINSYGTDKGRCPRCSGTGQRSCSTCGGYGTKSESCSNCSGKGRRIEPEHTCPVCEGEGELEKG